MHLNGVCGGGRSVSVVSPSIRSCAEVSVTFSELWSSGFVGGCLLVMSMCLLRIGVNDARESSVLR